MLNESVGATCVVALGAHLDAPLRYNRLETLLWPTRLNFENARQHRIWS